MRLVRHRFPYLKVTSPDVQRVKHGYQGPPGTGELVLISHRPLALRMACDHVSLLELAQAVDEPVAGHACIALDR
jgi:hypothetical protein